MWNSHSEEGVEMHKAPEGLVYVEQLLAKGNVPHRRRETSGGRCGIVTGEMEWKSINLQRD